MAAKILNYRGNEATHIFVVWLDETKKQRAEKDAHGDKIGEDGPDMEWTRTYTFGKEVPMGMTEKEYHAAIKAEMERRANVDLATLGVHVAKVIIDVPEGKTIFDAPEPSRQVMAAAQNEAQDSATKEAQDKGRDDTTAPIPIMRETQDAMDEAEGRSHEEASRAPGGPRHSSGGHVPRSPVEPPIPQPKRHK